MSRHHRETGNRLWAELRLLVFERDGYRCTNCGKAGRFECHHVKPLHQGGGNELVNLTTLCRGCHLEAHARKQTPSETEWRRLVEETEREG